MGKQGLVKVDCKTGMCTVAGRSYQAMGFGTAQDKHKARPELIRQALEVGFRIFDTSPMYQSFKEVGEGLSGIDRKEIYVIGKLEHGDMRRSGVDASVHTMLREMKMDYLDACLIHWPNSQVPIEETLTAMEDLQRVGKIRHIGCSNFSIYHLRRALETGIPITWLQIEMNVAFFDLELLNFCRQEGIGVQTWFSLRGSHGNILLSNIGKDKGLTAEQVALRWIHQHGCIPLTSSSSMERMRENLHILHEGSLSLEEMETIDEKASHGERVQFSEKIMGFCDEFGFAYEECWPHKKDRKTG